MKQSSIIFLSAFLAGCASAPSEKEGNDPLIVLSSVDISLDSDANQNSATAIDLLVIYKKDLLDAVMKMSAQEYYMSALQIQRDFPTMVDVWHWELTPGQLVKNYPICLQDKLPVGAVIFADYLSPGDHRIRLSGQEKITLRLKQQDFCVLEMGCAADLNKTSIHKSSLSKKSQSLEALEHQLQKESRAGSGDKEEGNQQQLQSLTKEVQSVFSKFKK